MIHIDTNASRKKNIFGKHLQRNPATKPKNCNFSVQFKCNSNTTIICNDATNTPTTPLSIRLTNFNMHAQFHRRDRRRRRQIHCDVIDSINGYCVLP